MTELVAEKREILGRKVKYLREKGLIPAELYGNGTKNVHLSIPASSFEPVYNEAGEHAIINVVVDGKAVPVLINSVQIHPITREVIAIDFYQVDMKKKVTTNVPITFEGISPAVNDLDGVLVKTLKEVEVEALPHDIPNEIVVDLSVLKEIDTSIYIKDLAKSDAYSFILDSDNVVASVSAKREEELEPEPEETLTPEDVVVEGEEKRADEEGEGVEQSTGDESDKKESASEA